jgi:hypothetical protein
MRTTRRSLETRLGLRSLGRVLVSLALVTIPACSSSGSGGSPAATDDAGAQDGANDANATEDGAVDGGGDPARNADPQDLDPTNGDPSLDIAASWIYFDDNQPWVRAEFYGSWPPPATLYSWSCSVYLGTANAPAVTYTVQSLGGTRTDYAEGIDKAKIDFANEPSGFRVLFGDATLTFDHYGLDCSVKKTNPGTLAQDSAGLFEVKSRAQRPFGP